MAKVRCKQCRSYISKVDGVQVGLSYVCKDGDCQSELFRSSPKPSAAKKRRKAPKAPSKRLRVPAETAEAVLTRDRNRCRLCGGADALAIHHINYRSEYSNKEWENEEWNLITLCAVDHIYTVHGDKRKYKPLLLGLNWIWYTRREYMLVEEFVNKYRIEDD